MDRLHRYRVGEPYVPGRRNWPEHVEYNFRGGEHELRLFLADLTAREIQDVRRGEAEFALVVEQPVIAFCYRFGRAIPWSDAPYSWHRVPEDQRTLPEPLPSGEGRALLHVILVEARSGIVQVLREVSLSPAFTAALHLAIREQAVRPWDAAEFDRVLTGLYRQYPTSAALVARAVARTRGGA